MPFSYLNFTIPAFGSTKFINGRPYENDMEDLFDIIPVPYRTERLGRLRDLIIQIEADYKGYKNLKQKIEAGIGDSSDMEELHRRETWMKRDVTVYRRLNAMSIEGVTCARISGFSASFCQKK